MPKINTYGLTRDDFKRCFMVTVKPQSMVCPKCEVLPGSGCLTLPHAVVHIERIQALYDKCKDVMESCIKVECNGDVWVEIYTDKKELEE